MHPFLRYATEKQRDIVALIQELVECESPSDSPEGVRRFTELLIERTRDICSATRIDPGTGEGKSAEPKSHGAGPHLRLEFELPGAKKAGQLLGLGHSDTVWPMGTLAQMPFQQKEGRLWGPGVLDMKAGLAFFIFAVRALRELDVGLAKKVVLLVVSDEEIGSGTSREITEAEALRSEAVLVLEPGTGLAGKLKTARKGVGNYTISVKGKASHAGVDFAAGASAILELSRQITKVATFTDLDRGITVNPGIVRGGTRTNVIAAEAAAEIDIRVATAVQAGELHRKFQSLAPFDTRCTLSVTGGMNRPPMERTPAIESLFRKARTAAGELGLTLEESSTGGGSDGNFTAALGIPTLDGLGAVGEGAHASNESILVDRIADRTAMLAALLKVAGGWQISIPRSNARHPHC